MTTEARFPEEAADPSEIVRTLAEVRKRPPPKDLSSLGCMVAIAAIVVIVLMPFPDRVTGLLPVAPLVIGIGLGVTAFLAGLLGIFGGGFVRGGVIGDVEEAIVELIEAYPDGNPAVLRSAAVRILDQTMVSTGPASIETFNRVEVAERLGNALGYVMQVERILLQRDEIYPCFTLLDQPPLYDDDEDLEDWT